MRVATIADLAVLVELMAGYYREAGYAFDADRAGDAFRTLLAEPRLGAVWLIEQEQRGVGYAVVTLGYSMEYGGLDAFLDDLFVQPAFRNAGLGTAALATVREYCASRGVRALHLEVERGNPAAQRIYERAGFQSTDRQLLTLRLADLEVH
jgi:GNAT superfamily N-acetyltransferase